MNTYKGRWRGCRRRGWPSSPTAARWTPSSPPPPPPRWWWMSPRAPTLLCTARYPGSSPGNLLRVTDSLSRWAFTQNLISIDDCSRLKFINGSDDRLRFSVRVIFIVICPINKNTLCRYVDASLMITVAFWLHCII